MEYELPTGRLVLDVVRNETGLDIGEVFEVAARANPRRGFLIVSTLIGRHLPTRPDRMRDAMRRIAERIPDDIDGPVLFVGMAETAVGLGQGVHNAWRTMTGRTDALFIQSTRQTHPEMPHWTSFEEGHSHATTHIVHRPGDEALFASARTLVMVDDECSTGKTFVAAEQAIRRVVPGIRRAIQCVITDWSPNADAERVSLVGGSMEWVAGGTTCSPLGSSANRHGDTDPSASPGRIGYSEPPRITERTVVPRIDADRVLVLSDGENAYDALLVAEAIRDQGADVALQSITRSPAVLGGAMRSMTVVTDAHGSGATCYAYNLIMHEPDVIVIVAERAARQADEIAASLGMPRERILLLETLR